jgi:hypothetical protein
VGVAVVGIADVRVGVLEALVSVDVGVGLSG